MKRGGYGLSDLCSQLSSLRLLGFRGQFHAENLVRDGITGDHQPRRAAVFVLPQVAGLARGIVTVVDIVVPDIRPCIRRRTGNVLCRTDIVKFSAVTFSAM